MYDLPNLPAKHQDFISYVQSHQDKPIEDLVQPYNEYDAVARKVFAQEPSHPALKDNHLNLVPLYDETTKSNNVQVLARNPDTEPQELRDQYLLPLKNKDRRPTGSPAVVPSLEEFQKNFTLFSEGALSDLDWSNVVVAGSAVVTSLLPVPEKHRGSKRALRQFYHEKFAPASDVDLFLYGLTDEEAVEKINHIELRIKNTILYETTTVRTKNTITIVSQYPTRHVQIVLRIYKSVAEILTGFDVDCSCAAYDGKQVYASPRALASYITQINQIDMTRRSPSYENRLSKYSHRGFEVFWPSLDRSRIDPTIFERSFSRTVGLARLLVLEKLPKTEDRENYLMQRRAERGRPLANRYAQRMKQLPGNIKDDWDDEAPEWQEEDEISDYNHFSIPYGPRYHAKRIERLLFTKDLLLNAEWNRPKDRTVWLHRHPAFFGDVEDVIHDCCGYCPEPVTDEEKEVAEEENKIYISGDVSFIKDDPGRQEIGSFNPITDTDWTEMAYIGNTEQLCQAIVDHDLAAVKEWLSRDSADPNTRDYTGRTPLHLASLTSTPEIVQCLVDHGARMISRVADGRTALHFAATRGNVEIVRVLLTKSEQNEEQEAKKEELRKSEPTQEKEEKEKPTGQSEEDDDIDMVSNDDGSSRTSGSFVKVEAPESGDAFDGTENELEPDIYDVNVLAWDSHTSPLHLAILNGHVDVVEELVSSFGADVLLPIKLLSSENTPTAAILTLVLALQLPLEKAKAMTQKLLQLGASPAQADLNHNTPLHYLAASKYSELLDLYHHHDEPAVKRAIDHLAFAGHSWNPEPYSAFTAAINAKNVIGAVKMLEAGAEPTLEFSHFVKSAKAVFDTIQSNSSEENQNIFRYSVAQPIILAVKKELPELVIDLLGRGVDPNPLTAEGCSVIDDEDVRDYKKGSSLLYYVREKIKSLQVYNGEECTSSPPRPLETDDKIYLDGIEEGTYAMLTARQQVKEARQEYEKALKNHEDSVNEARNCKGVDLKLAAAKDLAEEFQRVEAVLLEKGAKTFSELYPDIKAPKEDEEEEEEDEPLKKDKFKVTYKFDVPDLTDTKRKGYLELYNAAWNGDLTTIKALTLATWGPDNEEAPLQIAVTDRHLLSPFSIAVLRGHLSVAKAILEVVQAQYKPKEQKGHKRYTADYDTDQPRIYSEIVDDQFTVDNIGEVATQVECPIKPLEVLQWECSARLFIENDAISDSERYEVQSGIEYVLRGYFSTWRIGDEASRIPQHLVDYAVWTDNVSLLVFLLELGQELTSQDTERDSTIYTVPERVFVMAIGLGRLRCLEELIKRTGAGMPIDEFVEKSGVKVAERPDYYQGLTIRGKKRADWARSERQGRPEKSKSSPLLVAASYGNLDSTKWFLGKEPGQQYVAFTKTYEHDKRLKHLEKSAKGVDGALMNWLKSRSGLSLHCAILSKPNEESERLVEYLAKQYPGGLETRSLEGHTPLALAFSLHRPSYAKILIEAGADQTTRDRSGNNLIHLLLCDKNGEARDKPHNIESLLALLDSRLIPSLLTERSSEHPGSLTPLARWILRAYGFDSYQSNGIETDGKTAVLRIVLNIAQLSGQKHLEMLDGAGNTPIHNAVKGELPQALELMVDRRADLLHRESATGTTPFEMAVDKWVHKATEGPPHIPPETPSWWGDEDAPYREVLEQQPEYFVEKKKVQDVQRVICELCRERAQTSGQKRKLVTLYEANEVAKRLAAKSHGDDEGKEVEVDEVRTWYEGATHEREE